jgi:hypothetical protein
MTSREFRGTTIAGWFSPQQGEWLQERVRGLAGGAIALVGIYQGLNVSYVAELCRDRGIRLLAVDVWEKIGDRLNGRQYKPGALGGFREDLRAARMKFERWVAELGFGDHVEILQASSLEAAGALPDASLDLVFLDADHGYDEVRQDLAAWAPKLRPGRLLAGDDWDAGRWPGVVQAVEELARARGLAVRVEHQLWSCAVEAGGRP